MGSGEQSDSWNGGQYGIVVGNYILLGCALLYDLFYVSIAWFKHDDPAVLFIYSVLFVLNLLNTLAIAVLLYALYKGTLHAMTRFYLVVNSCTCAGQVLFLVYIIIIRDSMNTPKSENVLLLVLVLLLELIYVGANGVMCYFIYVHFGPKSESVDSRKIPSYSTEIKDLYQIHEQTLNRLDKEFDCMTQLVKCIQVRTEKETKSAAIT